MKLLIVGAGGHGRCCLDIARETNKYDEISFLDDQNIGTYINDCTIIGSVDDMSSFYIEYENIFIAIGDNHRRSELILKAKTIGFTIESLFSVKSSISDYTTIGEGCVIFPFAVIEANAHIGKGCIITANVTINHDSILEDYCLVYSNSVIRPGVVMKSMNRIKSGIVVEKG